MTSPKVSGNNEIACMSLSCTQAWSLRHTGKLSRVGSKRGVHIGGDRAPGLHMWNMPHSNGHKSLVIIRSRSKSTAFFYHSLVLSTLCDVWPYMRTRREPREDLSRLGMIHLDISKFLSKICYIATTIVVLGYHNWGRRICLASQQCLGNESARGITRRGPNNSTD